MLEPHNPAWTLRYQETASELQTLLPEGSIARIHHIGSTAVPGLIAKPTVDILPETTGNADLQLIRQTLTGNGYLVMKFQPGEDFRLDMCKGYTPQGFAEKVFHLHIRPEGDWDEPYFCRYLREHGEVAGEYGLLKKRLAGKNRRNRDAYTAAKGGFVARYTCLARNQALQRKSLYPPCRQDGKMPYCYGK